MRSKTVQIGGKTVVINEQKIKQLKDETIAKLPGAFEALQAVSIGAAFVEALENQVMEFFPELKNVDIEDCYPSEIEEFLEAWSDVNFTGLKRLFGPLMFLANLGKQVPEFDSGNPLVSLITGKA